MTGKVHWLWKAGLVGIMVGLDGVLIRLGILDVAGWWVVGILALIQVGALMALQGMQRILLARAGG